MAANPIQYLKHGKALCGKVFRAFVETFNWHTAFCLNLKGDGDFPASQGKISLDRSNPDFPVIRCKGCTSSGGGGGSQVDMSCFRIVDIDGDRSIVDCYVMVGGSLMYGTPGSIEHLIPDNPVVDGESDADIVMTVIYAQIPMPYNSSGMTFGSCLIAELGEKQTIESQYVIPLYIFDQHGNLLTDLRNAPNIQSVEFLYSQLNGPAQQNPS